jgi:hypothetical protein
MHVSTPVIKSRNPFCATKTPTLSLSFQPSTWHDYGDGIRKEGWERWAVCLAPWTFIMSMRDLKNITKMKYLSGTFIQMLTESINFILSAENAGRMVYVCLSSCGILKIRSTHGSSSFLNYHSWRGLAFIVINISQKGCQPQDAA